MSTESTRTSSATYVSAKRGDTLVSARGINFAIQRGLQFFHSTVHWFNRNVFKSLEDVPLGVERKCCKRRGRRFIVADGIFEKGGAMVDLPKTLKSCEVRDSYGRVLTYYLLP